jgi:DNA-binding CsgD family transcriptional regulator
MSVPAAARVAKEEIGRLAHAGLDSFSYRQQVARKLRKALPFDGVWWWTTDPATSFFTSGVFEPCPEDHLICSGLHTNEFVDPDYNKFRVLARRSGHVGVLSRATGGRLERSDRYHRVLLPLGYEHELRLALVDGSTCWGALALLRGPESPDFSPADVRVAASLCSALTEGLRIGLVLGAVSVDTAPDGPGLMILDDELEILPITPNAERWLEELHDESPGVPDAIRSVVACVQQVENADGAEEQTPRARVRGRSGRWLVIHGSRTRERDGRAAGTAVIIEEAKPSEIAPIIVRAYGLSERETNITRLILQGLSTKEIAAEVYVSPYTIQDQLKSIFDKVGVRSRRELAARILDRYYLPRFGDGDNPPEPDGAVAGLHLAA